MLMLVAVQFVFQSLRYCVYAPSGVIIDGVVVVVVVVVVLTGNVPPVT